MNTHELIKALSQLSDKEKLLPVCVEDGMDPSDPTPVTTITVEHSGRFFGIGRYEWGHADFVYLS